MKYYDAVAVIETARSNVARAVVSTSNEMHWNIGKLLYERKLDSNHGDSVVKRLSVDLKAIYPKMGMSVSNLWAMKKYYDRFHLSDPKLQRCVGVLPWRHINQLMTKLKKDDDKAIQYYAEQTIAKGWSRDLLVNTIKMNMLFFHRRLRSLVAIDLKIPKFKPEYVGKMNIYFSLLDRLKEAMTRTHQSV